MTPFSGPTTNWQTFQELWRSLTQSCRPLRSEFLSMLSDHKFHIELCDLGVYLHFPCLQAGFEPKTAVTSGFKAIRGIVEVHVTEPRATDITNTISLSCRMQGVQVGFNKHWLHDMSPEFFQCDTKFSDYVAKRAENVQVKINIRDSDFPGAKEKKS